MHYFAEVLLKYDLNIITPKPNYPKNRLIENWEEKVPSQFIGKVKYLPLIIPSNRIKLSRVLSYFTYMVNSFVYSLLKMGKSEIVICSSPPITTAFAAALFVKVSSKKIIVDIRDMWPQIGIELGILKSKFAIGLLNRMEHFILRRANKIIVTAQGDKDNLVNRNYDSNKIEIISNGADTSLFNIISDEEKGEIKKHYDIPLNKYILIYFGSFNYGMNDLDGLSESLSIIGSKREDLHFIAIGNGERKKTFVNSLKGKINFQSFDSMDIKEISKLVAASDISLIPRKNIKQDTGGNIPVKCFESWSSGIPTVLSSISDTDIQRIFNDCGCGILVEAGNAVKFAEAIEELVNSNNLTELGKKGREFVIQNFDRKKQSEKLVKIIEELEKS
jgi:glycosyltransferase involved in cell wall biosynthesis